MEFLSMGFLIGVIITIIIISLVMNSKIEPQEKCERDVTIGEMFSVVNYYYHFEKATPYEKEVMSAILNKLEGELEHEMDKGRD